MRLDIHLGKKNIGMSMDYGSLLDNVFREKVTMSTTTAIRRGLTENQDKVLTRQPTKDKGTARQRPHKGRRHPNCCRCQPGRTRLGLHLSIDS
uniref:Uncharacterized protein n=1 Tax=Oryza glumipatula TaxID=40148 RepID=A0A0E0BJ88_9ORYZ